MRIRDGGLKAVFCFSFLIDFNFESSLNVISFKFEQPVKRLFEIDSIFEGTENVSNELLKNALLPILLIFVFFSNLIDFMKMQSKKAFASIVITFEGIVIVSIFVFENAFSPIVSNFESFSKITVCNE